MHNRKPKTPGIAFLVGLSAFSSSCFFRHTPMVFTPPPARAQPPLPPSAPPLLLPPPPQIAADAEANLPTVAASIPELAPPPAPKPQQKKAVVAPPPKPAAAPTPDQSPSPPKLVQLFTPEQEREYNRNIDESLDRVRRALAILSGKRLNSDQAEAANRIAAFQKQAEEARNAHDLAGADLLARRAATLADDLLTRVP
jgi:hypothetical protein